MVTVDPVVPGKVLFAGADGQPCISRDSGKTYTTLPALEANKTIIAAPSFARHNISRPSGLRSHK